MNWKLIIKSLSCALSGTLIMSLACSCSPAKIIGADAAPGQEQGQVQSTTLGKAFTFVQLSDPQLGFLNGNDDFAADSLLLYRAIAKVNDLKPSFVLMTGDMTHASGKAAQIRCYKAIVARLKRKIPLYQVPGNHDVGSGSTDEKVAKYISNYGDDHFSFDYKKCHFVGINSCVIKDENKALEEKQWNWLSDDLKKASNARRTFVICHHSFFLRTYTEDVTYSNQSQENRDRYWSLFKENGVNCVIAGHLHDNKQARYEDIDMITVGPVGKPLGNGYSGVCVWKVDELGAISHRYYSIDEFESLTSL